MSFSEEIMTGNRRLDTIPLVDRRRISSINPLAPGLFDQFSQIEQIERSAGCSGNKCFSERRPVWKGIFF